MAEIGLAASVIAVLQLSQAVLTGAYEYGRSVKNAESDMKKIRDELGGANSIFNKLQALQTKAKASGISLTDWPTLASFDDTNNIHNPLKNCKVELEGLVDDLKPAVGRVSAVIQKALWGRQKKKVAERFDRLRSQIALLERDLDIEKL